jgi:hypothetical protein
MPKPAYRADCRLSLCARSAARDEATWRPVALSLFAPAVGVEKRASDALARRLLRGRAMSKLLRGLAAGWGAKKLGGGCFTTILIFGLLWYLLGHFQIFR